MSFKTDALSGIRLKRQRAWDQLNGLNPELKAFSGSSPYTPRIEFKQAIGELIVSVHANKTPNPMWGVRISEIIHNLRSALDHLAWELVILNTGGPPPKGNKNQFAIYEFEAGFSKRGINDHLANVGQAAIDWIRNEQPFPQANGGTGEDAKSPLWHLHELSNADKHRTLHVTGTILRAFDMNFGTCKFDLKTKVLEQSDAGPVQQDMVLHRRRFWHESTLLPVQEWPFSERTVEGKLSTDVAFDERTPAVGGWIVFPTLVDIANRVDRILTLVGKERFRIEL